MKEYKRTYERIFKRPLGIILALLQIILFFPLLVVLYVTTFICMHSNPIFKQYRVGKNGKLFVIYKFKTMRDLRDAKDNLLPDNNRITRWGKFMRLTTLDELPQLFNVLRGDMAIVGPRPRIVEECVFLDDSQKDRYKMLPGIVGWAFINGRNSITFDKVVEFDKEYVENVNFKSDLKIFFKSLIYIFKRKNVNKVGTVSNEFHGDYLLRTGQISQNYYNEKIALAQQIKFDFERNK